MPKNSKISAISVALVGPMAKEFLKNTGAEWTPTRLGREAVKDPSKIFLILKGQQQIRESTARKIIARMDKEIPGFSDAFVRRYVKESVDG